MSPQPPETHSEKEKAIFEFFNGVIREANIIFLKKPDEKSDQLPARIQLIIAFSVLDTMATYWDLYLNSTPTNNPDKIKLWVNTFCSVIENVEFRKHPNWNRKISGESIYRLRCSVVHFFALPEPIDDWHFGLSPSDFTAESMATEEAKYHELGIELLLIKPQEIYILIKEGAILMLDEWRKTINASQNDSSKKKEYIEGIERVYKKFSKEGAIKIPLKRE